MNVAVAVLGEEHGYRGFEEIPDAEKLNREGLGRLAVGDLRGALAAFRAATRSDADYAEAWTNSGRVLAQLRRHAEAVFDFDQALSLNLDNVEAMVHRGRSLQSLGDFEAALADFDRALQGAPAAAEAALLDERAALLHACGDLAGALAR
jgi:tetratricopeptide (TPR) repeat protein